MTLPRTCLYCDAVGGCGHLGDPKGRFILERVITEDAPRDCTDWTMVGHRQHDNREKLKEIAGEANTVRTHYLLPDIVLDGMRQGEKDELMFEEIPDFDGMRIEGMTTTEREEQLRYETDEDNNVIVETDAEGNEFKRARPSYQLKAYVTQPLDNGGVIGLAQKVAMLWTVNPLIDYVLKHEVEQGLITKVKKPKGKAAVEGKPEPTQPKPEKARETKSMATGRRVRVSRSAGGAAKPAASKGKAAGAAKPRVAGKGEPAAGGRVASPPKKAGAGKAAAAPATAAAGPNMEEVMVRLSALEEKMEANHKETLAAISESRSAGIDATTILHDMAVQTGGSFAFPQEDEEGNLVVDEDGNVLTDPLPELFPKESKILAYLDGTAYEDGGEVDEDEDEEAGE